MPLPQPVILPTGLFRCSLNRMIQQHPRNWSSRRRFLMDYSTVRLTVRYSATTLARWNDIASVLTAFRETDTTGVDLRIAQRQTGTVPNRRAELAAAIIDFRVR